jgi:DNA replication protein DnaC
VTTNEPVTQCGAVFGDEMTAAASLNRLLHHSYRMLIQGQSYRLRQKKRAVLLAPSSRG